MTVHQRTAIEHPCYLAMETAHPRFCFVLPGSGCSAVLTVNSGYE